MSKGPAGDGSLICAIAHAKYEEKRKNSATRITSIPKYFREFAYVLASRVPNLALFFIGTAIPQEVARQ